METWTKKLSEQNDPNKNVSSKESKKPSEGFQKETKREDRNPTTERQETQDLKKLDPIVMQLVV